MSQPSIMFAPGGAPRATAAAPQLSLCDVHDGESRPGGVHDRPLTHDSSLSHNIGSASALYSTRHLPAFNPGPSSLR